MAVIETENARLAPGVAAADFVAADAQAVDRFWSRCPGVDAPTRTLRVAADGSWTTGVRWESASAARAAREAAAQDPAVAACRALVDAGSLRRDLDVEVSPADDVRVRNARGLYLEGIGQGRAAAALEAYTGDRYTQHSTGVRDGRAGFLEFFEPFLAAHPQREITVPRAFADGRYVFLHAHQRLDGGATQWVTMDLFDTDGNGRIVEHWDVIAPGHGVNPAGRTQVDGATEVTDLHLTERNKDVVRGLLTEGLSRNPTAELSRFISAERYLQHNPAAPDGLDGLQHLIEQGRVTGETLHYERVHRLIGRGNFVAALSHQVWNSVDYAAVDLFRLDGGLIVEHWDAVEPLPDEKDLVNSGKF